MKREETEYPGFELWPEGSVEDRETHIGFLWEDGKTNFWLGFGWGVLVGVFLLLILLWIFLPELDALLFGGLSFLKK